MKRVLLACYEVPGYGGAATAHYNLFKRMQQDGHDVSYLNLVAPEDLPELRRMFGPHMGNPEQLDRVHTYVLNDTISGSHPGLTRQLHVEKADVVISAGYIATLMVKRARPRQTVLFLASGCTQMQGSLLSDFDAVSLQARMAERRPATPVLYKNERYAVEAADLVATHSSLIRDVYRYFYPAQQSTILSDVIWKADFIHDAAKRHASAARPFAARDIDVLFVASRWNRPQKNHEFCARIAEHRPDWSIHMVGSDVPREVAGVTYHGFESDRAQLFALMGRAKTVVSTSSFDAAPGILFEAAALGANPIASKNCGNWQLCNEALLADPYTVKSFVECVERGLARPYPHNMDYFSRQHCYPRLLDLIESM